MDALKKTYRLTIQTITALHIGTGKTLIRDYDYVTQGNQTFVVNEEALAGALYDRKSANLIGDRAGTGLKVLFPQSYDASSPVFRYVLNGVPTSTTAGSEVQEQIKDMYDCPYIPGSSLKGAIRTALLYELFRKRKKPFSMSELGDAKAKFAALTYEKALFGKDPYHDVMRAMHVADSTPATQDALLLINASVVQRGKPETPINLEAVKPNTTFNTTLAIDTHLLAQQDKEAEIHWTEDQKAALHNFAKLVNRFTAKRLENDRRERTGKWKKKHQEIVDFLASYGEESGMAENQFVLQLGWGGGWTSKTLADHLTKQEDEFVKLVERHQLKRGGGRNKLSFRKGDMFPSSARVRTHGDELLYELGWILVTVEEA